MLLMLLKLLIDTNLLDVTVYWDPPSLICFLDFFFFDPMDFELLPMDLTVRLSCGSQMSFAKANAFLGFGLASSFFLIIFGS